MGENTLAQLLRDNKSGPFSNYCVTKWLDGKRLETKILEAYMNVMKDTTLVTEQGELDHIVARENAIVCFHFRLNCSDDELITAMKDMLESGSTRNRPKSGKHDKFDARRLFDDNVTHARTRNAIHLLSHSCFPHYYDYQKVNTDVCFLSYPDDDPANKMTCSIKVYKDGSQIETNVIPPSAPSVPCASAVTCNSTTLTWRKPHYGAEFIERYRILYRRAADINADWNCIETKSHEETFTVPKLQSSTVYVFKIQGKCKVGCSPSSDGSAGIKTESVVKKQTLAEFLINNPKTKLMAPLPTLHQNIYRLELDSKNTKDQKFRHFTLGDPDVGAQKQNKVLMIIGAIGAGKGTLINGIVNYILNVEWSDPYRFKVVTTEDEQTDHANKQVVSNTTFITTYEFYHHEDMRVPYNLTIIDTPGYEDCQDGERDNSITKQIKEFLLQGCDIVDHVDAVCFVIPAPDRLTATENHMINSILSIFAKDFEENIALLVTFADVQRPPVLDSIKEANIPYTDYYKFNNSALFSDNVDSTHAQEQFDSSFWDMGMNSLKIFFQSVHKFKPISLKLTKEVRHSREEIERTIQNLQLEVANAVNEMYNLEKEKETLQSFEKQIEDNKDFEYTVDEDVCVKVDLEPGTHVTNCTTCNATCHYPCRVPQNDPKSGCSVMKDGNCTKCSEKCHWTVHCNATFRFERKTVRRYQVAKAGKEGQQIIIQKLEEKYAKAKQNTLTLVQKLTDCIVKLCEMTLRPIALSTTGYIDNMIKSEQRDRNRGYEGRIKQLQELRTHAALFEEID